MSTDSFASRADLMVGPRSYEYFALSALGQFDIARLPYALKVLLENLLRHEDGVSVNAADIEALATWDPSAAPSREVAFSPARILLLAARSLGSIPFVRVQIVRLRHGSGPVAVSDRVQIAGAVVAIGAVMTQRSLVAGAIAVAALLLAQLIWVRRTPVPAKILGLRQLVLGLAIVAVTAAGVLSW